MYNKEYFQKTPRGIKSAVNAKQAFELSRSGMTNKQIAEKLGIIEVTVRERIRMYEYIIERGFLEPESYALPECPICRKFHKHEHGGLVV